MTLDTAASATPAQTIQDVVTFWFEETQPKQYFVKDPAFDQRVRDKLAGLHAQAMADELIDWQQTALGCLALCVVLDQAPRNMYRDDPRAFASDPKALSVAQYAVEQGLDKQLVPRQRTFIYLPFEHAEDKGLQAQSVALFKALHVEVAARDPEAGQGFAVTYDYALRHQAIVDRFGRFPHRNAVLGRQSTPEESAFLSEPGSSF